MSHKDVLRVSSDGDPMLPRDGVDISFDTLQALHRQISSATHLDHWLEEMTRNRLRELADRNRPFVAAVYRTVEKVVKSRGKKRDYHINLLAQGLITVLTAYDMEGTGGLNNQIAQLDPTAIDEHEAQWRKLFHPFAGGNSFTTALNMPQLPAYAFNLHTLVNRIELPGQSNAHGLRTAGVSMGFEIIRGIGFPRRPKQIPTVR
jgi:hypothetical protein